jgi:anti-sigma factor RsiW
MSEPVPLSEPERDELVAYLDGELKGEAARRIEERIAREPAVREEADALRRAWDLLDFLPLPEPSAEFTHRTVSRLTPVAATAVATGPPRPARRWVARAVAVGWAAAVGLALLSGYAATRVAAPREPGDRDLVRDLLVIENKHLYDPIDELDFVRELDAPELFGDDSAGT